MLKQASVLFGLLGVLMALMAVYGRFHGAPSMEVLGIVYAPSKFLIAANTLLLIGVSLGVLNLQNRSRS